MKRIIIPNPNGGHDNSLIKKAVDEAAKICLVDNSIKSVVFLVPTQNNVAHLELTFGEQTLKDIVKGKGVTLYKNGPGVRILTDKTIKNCEQTTTVVIASYVSYQTLLKADELYNAKAIIAVPWLKDEFKNWINTWNPDVIDQQGIVSTSTPITITNNVVKRAIDSFPHKTIAHDLDKNRFITKFRVFKKFNVPFNTDEIFSYLVREKNWTNEDAIAIKEIGDKINEGKTLHGGETTDLKKYFDAWNID